MAGFDINFDEFNPDTVDRGYPPAGWYRAIVEDSEIDDKTGATVMTYKITDGVHQEQTIKDRIFDPNMAADEEKKSVAIRRAGGLALRLGLVKSIVVGKDAKGRDKKGVVNLDGTPVASVDFGAAIGKDVVLHLTSRKYTDKNGNEKETTGVDFMGVYLTDHPDIPDSECAALGLPPRPPKPVNVGKRTVNAPTSPPQANPAAVAAGVNLDNL